MSALFFQIAMGLRLHFRNGQALVYGYIFPVLFVGVFWVLYRHEPVPLLLHFGQLLTISVLAGACFGLPTTLVNEREHGIWRRYRLAPTSIGTLLLGTVATRYVLLASAALLQWALARAIGMTEVGHAIGLCIAFTAVAIAFMGLGLVMAMLAPNVPAVQALGQCIFLPMLIVGGVAVPISALPGWVQQLSGFLPGRHAVVALQRCVAGDGITTSWFEVAALLAVGTSGFLAAALLFSWESRRRRAVRSFGAAFILLATFLAVGITTEMRERKAVAQPPPAAAKVVEVKRAPWQTLTDAQLAALDYRLPADTDVVTPFASDEEEVDEYVAERLREVERNFASWAPDAERDPVQRVRNNLCALGLADIGQSLLEAQLPRLVLHRLAREIPRDDLIRILGWIALHPQEGRVLTDLDRLGIPEGATDDEAEIRRRAEIYAKKFIVRLKR